MVQEVGGSDCRKWEGLGVSQLTVLHTLAFQYFKINELLFSSRNINSATPPIQELTSLYTMSAPYCSARSRMGSLPALTMGASTTFPP